MLRVVLLLMACLSSALGVLAMSGRVPDILATGPRADLVLSPFPLPADLQIASETVATGVAGLIEERAANDPALRIMMGNQAHARLLENVIPRLVGGGFPALLERSLPELRAAGEAKAVRQLLTGEVRAGRQGRNDVVLTVPGGLWAMIDGAPAELTESDAGVPALSFGELPQGSARHVVVWLDDTALAEDWRHDLLLGAAGGVRGRVWLRQPDGWFGADLQVHPLARWSLATLAVIVCVGSLAGLGAVLLGGLRRQARGIRPMAPRNGS